MRSTWDCILKGMTASKASNSWANCSTHPGRKPKISSANHLLDPSAFLHRVENFLGAGLDPHPHLGASSPAQRFRRVVKARNNLRQQGIRACYFLQFGYPGESWNDVKKTLNLVNQTRPDDVGVSVSYPLPGTSFFERVSAQLGSKKNWAESGDLSMMFQGAYTDEFYRALHDFLHAEVDSWNGPHRGETAVSRASSGTVAKLWRRVVELEATCRRTAPAAPMKISNAPLVQLQGSRPLTARVGEA